MADRGEDRGSGACPNQHQSAASSGPMSSGARILDGFRVIDCSEGLAGPVAGLLLAEAGADVVKVERPGGDPARATPAFLTWNRSKRSVVLDLASETGRRQLHQSAGRGRRPHPQLRSDGRPRTWGSVTPPSASVHPHLIHSAVPGLAGRPSRVPTRPSTTCWSVPGSACATSSRATAPGPVFLRFPVGSWCAAYLATIGVLARLLHRERGASSGGAGPHQRGPRGTAADHDALGPGGASGAHVRLRAAEGALSPRCSSAATACGST